jgi:putative resolvase
MIEGLISFCVRRYGRRGSRNRALRAVTCASRPPGHASIAPGSDGGDR